MAGKKKQKRSVEVSRAKQKELKASLAELRGQLAKTERQLSKAEERAERWKKAAKERRKAAPKAGDRAEKRNQPEPQTASRSKSKSVSSQVAAPTEKAKPAASDALVTDPDQTWTVAQLRAEARARGLAGMSNKPKAQLLAALTRGTAASRSSS